MKHISVVESLEQYINVEYPNETVFSSENDSYFRFSIPPEDRV